MGSPSSPHACMQSLTSASAAVSRARRMAGACRHTRHRGCCAAPPWAGAAQARHTCVLRCPEQAAHDAGLVLPQVMVRNAAAIQGLHAENKKHACPAASSDTPCASRVKHAPRSAACREGVAQRQPPARRCAPVVNCEIARIPVAPSVTATKQCSGCSGSRLYNVTLSGQQLFSVPDKKKARELTECRPRIGMQHAATRDHDDHSCLLPSMYA